MGKSIEALELEHHIRLALEKILLNTHASTWGRNYSISKEEDRQACIEDLAEKLIFPVLKELGTSLAKAGIIEKAGQAIVSNGRWQH